MEINYSFLIYIRRKVTDSLMLIIDLWGLVTNWQITLWLWVGCLQHTHDGLSNLFLCIWISPYTANDCHHKHVSIFSFSFGVNCVNHLLMFHVPSTHLRRTASIHWPPRSKICLQMYLQLVQLSLLSRAHLLRSVQICIHGFCQLRVDRCMLTAVGSEVRLAFWPSTEKKIDFVSKRDLGSPLTCTLIHVI